MEDKGRDVVWNEACDLSRTQRERGDLILISLILHLYVNWIVDFSSPTEEGSGQKQFVWENSSFFV